MSANSDIPSAGELLDERAPQRPAFMEPLPGDKVLDAVLRLAMELSVLRDRMDATEAVLSEADPALLEKIESFVAPPELEQRRMGRRQALIHRLLRDLS
jgi:hypothetical protein